MLRESYHFSENSSIWLKMYETNTYHTDFMNLIVNSNSCEAVINGENIKIYPAKADFNFKTRGEEEEKYLGRELTRNKPGFDNLP
jgi:hypothetical protein